MLRKFFSKFGPYISIILMVGIYEICWLQTTVLVDKPANYYNDLNGTVEIKCIDNAKVIVSKTKTFTLHDMYGRIVYCK